MNGCSKNTRACRAQILQTRTRLVRLPRHPVLVLALYLIVALFILRSIFHLPWTTVPTGNSEVATVPLLNMWTVWWNCHQLEHGFSDYWNAPIFHPVSGAFSFSEPQTLTILLWPIWKLTGSLVLSYKVWLVTAWTLNGFTTWLLLRDCRIAWSAAFAAGVLMQTLPILFTQMDAIQLCHLWPSILTLRCILQLLKEPTLRRGMVCGLAFAVSFSICIHQTLLLSISLIGGTTVWLRHLNRPLLVATVVAILTAATIVLPFAGTMQRNLANHGFTRSIGLTRNLSADWSDYTRTSYESEGKGRSLCPGYGILGAAVFAAIESFRRRRRTRWVVFLMCITLSAVLMSLGPHLQVLGYRPWIGVRAIVPGADSIRNVFRFAIIAHVFTVLLAAFGLHSAAIRCRISGQTFIPVLVAILALMAFEAAPPVVLLAAVPDERQPVGWAIFLEEHERNSGGCLCLPMATELNVEGLHTEALWMFRAVSHKIPLANGYSGFFPQHYLNLRKELQRSDNAISREAMIGRMGIQWLVIDDRWKGPEEVKMWIPSARLVFRDRSSQVSVYRWASGMTSSGSDVSEEFQSDAFRPSQAAASLSIPAVSVLIRQQRSGGSLNVS